MPLPIAWTDTAGPVTPNGKFTIHNADLDVNESFLFYTVQGGSLQHMRIVKFYDRNTGRYKGFASLQDDGSIKLWQSARAMRNTFIHLAAIEIARSFFDFLSTNDSGVRNIDVHGDSFTVTYDSACVRCNDFAVVDVNNRWCSRHRSAVDDHRTAIDQEQRVIHYESDRARRRTARPAPRVGDPIHYNFVIEDEAVAYENRNEISSTFLSAVDDVVRSETLSVPFIDIERPLRDAPVRRDRPSNHRNPEPNILLSENGTGFVR